MPNLASCHQAIRCARVAAILACIDEDWMGEDWGTPSALAMGWLMAVEPGVAAANAPAAPMPLRNERRELEFQSMVVSPVGSESVTGLRSRSRRGEYISAEERRACESRKGEQVSALARDGEG